MTQLKNALTDAGPTYERLQLLEYVLANIKIPPEKETQELLTMTCEYRAEMAKKKEAVSAAINVLIAKCASKADRKTLYANQKHDYKRQDLKLFQILSVAVADFILPTKEEHKQCPILDTGDTVRLSESFVQQLNAFLEEQLGILFVFNEGAHRCFSLAKKEAKVA